MRSARGRGERGGGRGGRSGRGNESESAASRGGDASTLRKPRQCREIQPVCPSHYGMEAYFRALYDAEYRMMRKSMQDATKEESRAPSALESYNAHVRAIAKSNKVHVGGKPDADDAKTSQLLKDLSHIRDLKSQNYCCDFEMPAYVAPDASVRTGLSGRNRLNGSLRDHSNAVALVNKSSPTKQSNLQISRIPIGSVGTSEIAYQFTTLMVLGLAEGFAFVQCPHGIRDPLASGAFSGRDVRRTRTTLHDTMFVMAHTEHELLEHAPRFLRPMSMLERARALALAELQTSEISRIVTQTTDHLRYTCSRVVLDAEHNDGSCTWFALSLVIYLASDMRLHPVLERWSFTEYDLAIAHALLNYARQLVGNRSRESMSKLAEGETDRAKRRLDGSTELWKVSSERFVYERDDYGTDEVDDSGGYGEGEPSNDGYEYDDEGTGTGYDDDDDDNGSVTSRSETSRASRASRANASGSAVAAVVGLADMAVATRIVCTQELARKSRRIDAESAGVRATIGGDDGGRTRQTTPKGGSKSRADGGVSGMSGAPRVKATLEFLHLHFMQDNGFLLHLYADTPSASERAAQHIMEWQLASKNINRELRTASTETLLRASRACAEQTRNSIAHLLQQTVHQSPSIVSWSDYSGTDPVVHTGLLRRPKLDDTGCLIGGARLLVCWTPAFAQPSLAAKTTIAWSCATTTSLLANSTCKTTSAVLETVRMRRRVNSSDSVVDRTVRSKHVENSLRRTCTEVMGPGETGVARSVIVCDALIPVNSEVLHAALVVSAELASHHRKATEQAMPRHRDVVARAARTLHSCTTTMDAAEPQPLGANVPVPSVTPSNVFGIGMYLLECTRTAYNQIAPKQSVLAVPIAPESIPKSLEAIETKIVNPKTRPWCFLNVDDLRFEARDPAQLIDKARLVAGDDGGEALPAHVQRIGTHVTVTACGNHAISVPDALRLLSTVADEVASVHGVASRRPLLMQWRSVCYTSGIQCCTFHQFSNSVASREMNTKIEGTNKIEAPDNHYLAFPTIYQAYVVGHTNLPVMFEGTPWCDTYGSGYECGAIASVGINGRSCVSDFRNGAFSLMDQAQVDRLCARLGERGIVPGADGKSYLRVPMAYLGGLPRIMIPGVHSALDALEAAFKTLDRATSSTTPSPASLDTRVSIQVLPFSPFTQAVSPVVSASANGMDFRDNARKATGKGVADACQPTEHPRPLRTLRQDSILNSDLMAPVCVKLVSSRSDNMYETIEPAIASVLVFASQIVEISKKVCNGLTHVEYDALECDACLDRLRHEMLRFVGLDTADARANGCADEFVGVLLVDALVLFNCIFPLEFEVGKPCLLKALESAPGAACRRPVRRFADLDLESAVNAEDRAALVHFCARVFDDATGGSWERIREFLCMVATQGRTFDNSAAELRHCARCVELLGQAAWLVHSDDGTTPPRRWSPLHIRASPAQVEGADLCCVWVDRPNNCQPNRRTQRGAVLGLPNAGPQQVLMLLTGAFLENVRVQYVRNEGNMCLRMSACALKESDGVRLSAKSTCPVYSDNDEETFGTLAAKEAQAKRQVVAWHANNELIFEVATHFCAPRTDQRYAGAEFTYHKIAETLASWQAAGRVSTQQCDGERMLAFAVESMDALGLYDSGMGSQGSQERRDGQVG